MPVYFFLAICLLPSIVFAQASSTQKSLHGFSDYANQSAEEVNAVAKAIFHYYPQIFQKKSFQSARFACPVQLEEYYLKQARGGSAGLGPAANGIMPAFEALVKAAEDVDRKCKALDTYHKLEDYKTDDYTGAEKLIREFMPLLETYHRRQQELYESLEKANAKINPASHAYRQPADLMIHQLKRERAFLNLWKYNLEAEIHTGWDVALFEKSILETDAEIKKMEALKPALKYPASSMWPSFISGMKSILELKRNALDRYNHEAKKSDRHSNSVYLDLINYYNGVLVSDYNAFLGYAATDGFRDAKAILYISRFEIRNTLQKEELTITPFKDATVSLPALERRKTAISQPEFSALENYVAYINETFRRISHQRDVIRNLSSSASRYANLTSFAGRGGIQFKHEGFSLPLSYYQKTVAESKALNPAYSSVLNTRAEVILNILKEMDQIGLALEQEANSKAYEQDQCKRMYQLIERTKLLYETWDEKKERLFDDVRAIFETYPFNGSHVSWEKSGIALWELTTADHQGLFEAKRYYQNRSTERPSTEKIDQHIRQVLAQEYDNMKGIQKYGRSHGLCPYTPYEDLPKTSRYLSESLQELKPVNPKQYSSQHPYHRMVYHYNDIARYYNKFSELSPLPLLKTVLQPEFFEITYPAPNTEDNPESQARPIQQTQVIRSAPETSAAPVSVSSNPDTKVKVIRDTVYIEKRDTIYLKDTDENLRSMEGYATNNMILLLDVSGSMNAPEKLPLLKQSIMAMLSMMRKEDEIAIVVFSGKPSVLLKPVSFQQHDKISKAIQSLKSGGTTDANAGIKLAYKVADENYIRGGNNRIILATDGEFGLNDDSRKLIADFSKQDIFLTVFNFGKAASTSRNLQQLASLGKGSYEFISRENVEMQLIREVKAKRKH